MIINGLKLAKLSGYEIIGWTWSLWRSPLLACKSSLSIKYSSPTPYMSRQCILPSSEYSPIIVITTRPWSELDLRKTFHIRIYRAKFWVSILAKTRFGSPLKVDWLISSWTWSKIRHFSFFDNIDRFRVKGIGLPHAGLYLILVLYRSKNTCPGPGFRCLWGIK